MQKITASRYIPLNSPQIKFHMPYNDSDITISAPDTCPYTSHVRYKTTTKTATETNHSSGLLQFTIKVILSRHERGQRTKHVHGNTVDIIIDALIINYYPTLILYLFLTVHIYCHGLLAFICLTTGPIL